MSNNSIIRTGDKNNLGWFSTESDLIIAHPTGVNGNFAIIGETDTFYIWDSTSSSWVQGSSQSKLTTKGDILTYDTSDKRLGIGTLGQVLTVSEDASGDLITIWEDTSGGTSTSPDVTIDGGTFITPTNVLKIDAGSIV